MARRSLVQRLLGDELVELRLMRLPLDVRYVWEHLVEIIGRRGTDGRLRLGSELGSELGFAGWFAHWFRRSETEIETHLRILAEAGLLTLDADAIGLPGLSPAAQRRSDQARINGSKGGRPRGAAATTPDQASMPLRFAGLAAVPDDAPNTNAGKPTVTQTVTQDANTPLAPASCLAEDSSEIELAASRAETEAAPPGDGAPDPAVLAAELLVLLGVAGLNREPDTAERVAGWLALGVAPGRMRQIVRDQAARPARPGKERPATLAWFDWKMRGAAEGPQLVAAGRGSVHGVADGPAMAIVPPDPRVATLKSMERSSAERLLFNLERLREAGRSLEARPPSGDAALQSASFTRSFARPAYDAVLAIYPAIAGWFGDAVPEAARAEAG